tara:strand:+ start:109 stop:348 length:240 start_codon:yes stop_codon:yes gene_type:complete
MEAVNIISLLDNINKGDRIHDMDGNYIGSFTGYNTRGTFGTCGAIECHDSNNRSIWVRGKAVFIFGLGVKFVENFSIDN